MMTVVGQECVCAGVWYTKLVLLLKFSPFAKWLDIRGVILVKHTV